MVVYKIDGSQLRDWKSFHSEFRKRLDFPDYYGENMNAWIDCMGDLVNQPTLLHIDNSKKLKESNPELLEAIFECAAFLNFRELDIGRTPQLLISAYL